MKRKVFVLMLIFSALVFSGCLGKFYSYKKNPGPSIRQGTVKLPQLASRVEVYFDEYGVPQVFTENEHDLFFTIGWLQAQDRLFEMVLLRALSEGRLSEILGDLPLKIQGARPLDYDIHQRVWGIKYLGEAGSALAEKYRPDLFAQIQAYCDGVNTYIKMNEKNLPVELQVLNFRPDDFQVADVLSLGLFIGHMLAYNYNIELVRYAMLKEYGWDLTWKAVPFHTQMGPTIVPPEYLKNKLAKPDTDFFKGTPRPEELELSPKSALALARAEADIRQVNGFVSGFASNNWAVSGKLTTDGNAILCNDPHLEHLQPSLFYLMRIKGAGFDTYGVAFPGEPFLVLGHTRKLAWAATTTEADVQDIYVEKLNPENPNQYLYKGEWKDFVEREEEIRVRVGFTNKFKVKKLKVRHTLHGPVMNDTLKNLPPKTPPLAVRWTGWDFCRDLRVFEALVSTRSKDEFLARFEKLNREKPVELMNIAVMYNILMKGKSVDDFKKAMDTIVVPNQNWLAADADGHIAYIPGGLVPIRSKGRGMLPVPGWTGDYEWTGFIPLMELPLMIDPERGYIATANNEVVDMEWYPYTFASNYSNGWRAARIEELLRKEQPLDVEKMRKIQNDIYSKEGESFAPMIVKAAEKKGASDPRVKQAIEYLKSWDYQTGTDSVASSIYYTTMKHLYENVLRGYFEPEFYQAYLSSPAASNMVQKWLYHREETFFQDKYGKSRAKGIDDALAYALEQAVETLTRQLGRDMSNWQWGKLHFISWSHPFGIGPMKKMNIGPFPEIGADQTVRNASFSGQGKTPFADTDGPVLRHIMNMGKPDEALMVIDGSESGRYLDPHYSDLHKLWLESRYHTAVMDEAAVKKNAKSVLTLEP